MLKRPKALDLFSGAGGAAMGLYRAGFDVIGVDNRPQPRYPFTFVQANALNPPFNLSDFDFIWASPPCQAYSQLTPREHRAKHPDLIEPIRKMLVNSGRPFVIENVPSAKRKLDNPMMLCGSMFGLKIQRHRFFEMGEVFALQPQCQHDGRPVLISGSHRRTDEPRYEYTVQQCRDASGLHWMTRKNMDDAIPPAYSEYIGRAALKFIERAGGEVA